MDYHRSIAVTCERMVAALSQTFNAHGYRLERSFDLRSARHVTAADQYLVLLAYEQTTSAPPIVITAHECDGITHLRAATIQPGATLNRAVQAAFAEVAEHLI